jgi:hypothetical protein
MVSRVSVLLQQCHMPVAFPGVPHPGGNRLALETVLPLDTKQKEVP